ncbi:hypothetical protein PRIPAC_74221, partial [Pristionchus pacificus]|uniref:Uncharacterized protein n=1 Tax=Pristionchus pacificus TaxID=54126 RepID=A0A2A6BWD0_PRIPA
MFELIAFAVNGPAVLGWKNRKDSIRWIRLADMESARSHAASCVADGKLYMIGGSELANDGECYNPITNNGNEFSGFLRGFIKFSPNSRKWEKLKGMNYARGGPTLVASRDFLFVIGGQGPNRNNVAEIEQFDPEKNEWRVVSELKRFSKSRSDLTISFPIPASFPSPNM